MQARTKSDRNGSAAMVEPLERRVLMSADMVLAWNRNMVHIFQDDSALPGPTVAARDMAIMDTAVSDAVFTLGGSTKTYLVHERGPVGASASAAASGAAYEALLNLFPSEHDALSADLNQTYAELGTGRAVTKGLQWASTSPTSFSPPAPTTAPTRPCNTSPARCRANGSPTR